MANRLSNPVPQFLDSTGEPLAGAKLFFYVTGTSTKANTYSDSTLLIPNANPLVLDSAGRLPACFLDPTVTYKAVLAPADDTDPPTAPIWTRDPVVDPAANVTASFQVFAGDPNGSVAGSEGAVGGSGASVVWDITNNLLYVCTTSGDASTAVWTQVGGALGGALVESGVISPAALGSNQDDYAPTGGSATSLIRLTASSAINITGLSISQSDGRRVTLVNIGSNPITLMDDATSTAANRFALNGNLVLGADESVTLKYDGTSSRWRATGDYRKRIATGSYTGNGATSQAITGVGFRPKYVRIWTRSATEKSDDFHVIETTDTMIDDNASGMAFSIYVDTGACEGGMTTDMIIALGADGFTVDDGGDDDAPNKNGVVYNYLAIG